MTPQEKETKITALKSQDLTKTLSRQHREKSAEFLTAGDTKNVTRIASVMPPADPKQIVLKSELQFTSSGDVHGVIERIIHEDIIRAQLDKDEIDIDSDGNIIPGPNAPAEEPDGN